VLFVLTWFFEFDPARMALLNHWRGHRMKPTANIPIGAEAKQEIEVTREMTVAHFHDDMPKSTARRS
jgi:hypothetical protein